MQTCALSANYTVSIHRFSFFFTSTNPCFTCITWNRQTVRVPWLCFVLFVLGGCTLLSRALSNCIQLAKRAAIVPFIRGEYIRSALLSTLGLRSCFNYQIGALSFAQSKPNTHNNLLDTSNAQHCQSVGRISCMTTLEIYCCSRDIFWSFSHWPCKPAHQAKGAIKLKVDNQ